jgi:hypothetical protein
MRKLLLSLVVVLILLMSVSAGAQNAGDLAQKPWSAGLLIGFSTFAHDGSYTTFTMEIPVEYTFVLGPGNLAAHFSFMLHAKDNYTAITLPLGARYKIHITNYPLYVYPLFDIGPSFVTDGGHAFGWIRFGGGVSYMVHPNIELMFQPLGLGAAFDSDFSLFVYNFLLGAQGRF